jgi:tRNA nucleotidyltransferase (CCA-adding enzyme)
METQLRKVCAAVLKRVIPDQEERARVLTLAEELRLKVSQAAEKAGIDATVRIEGSVAKDTWLSGEPDIDIFMQVPTSMSREAFGTTCLEIAKEATKGFRQVERFAEHPYLEAYVNEVRVNIVPCYRVKRGQWISATDRTPYHTDYVKARLDESLCEEIRLLKRFMKGIGAYGAEIKIGGFSGYLCELLVLRYKTFLGVLEAFADWRERKLIDYEGYYKGRENEARKVFQEPLIVVDPVDKGRNVASALRRERLDEFIAASRGFLQQPSEKYFYPSEVQPFKPEKIAEILKVRGSALILVKFGKVDAVPDVLWGQLYKSQRSLLKLLQRHDFKVIREAVWSNEKDLNLFLFEVEHRFLPPIKRHLGPPVEKRADCENFLMKHVASTATISGPRVEKGRWIVETRRKYTDVTVLLAEKLREDGRQVGVADLIAQRMKKSFNILTNKEILKLYKTNREFAKFLTKYLTGKPHWLNTNNS